MQSSKVPQTHEEAALKLKHLHLTTNSLTSQSESKHGLYTNCNRVSLQLFITKKNLSLTIWWHRNGFCSPVFSPKRRRAFSGNLFKRSPDTSWMYFQLLFSFSFSLLILCFFKVCLTLIFNSSNDVDWPGLHPDSSHLMYFQTRGKYSRCDSLIVNEISRIPVNTETSEGLNQDVLW